MIRFTALLAVLGAALVGVASIVAAPNAPKTLSAPDAAKTLSGSVGPSETIVLKKGSSRVSSIPRGRYTLVVTDRSSEHDFHLRGPVADLLDRRVPVLDRDGRLGEDRPGVVVGVHAVPGQAEDVIAVTDRPGHRVRAAVARQAARMLVDRAEARYVERLLRQLPREAPAERDVEVESAQEIRDRVPILREQDAEAPRPGAVRDLAPGAVAGDSPQLCAPAATRPAHDPAPEAAPRAARRGASRSRRSRCGAALQNDNRHSV
jgi:hypothetical protein